MPNVILVNTFCFIFTRFYMEVSSDISFAFKCFGGQGDHIGIFKNFFDKLLGYFYFYFISGLTQFISQICYFISQSRHLMGM